MYSGGCYCDNSRKISTISLSLGGQSKTRNSTEYIKCWLRQYVSFVREFCAMSVLATNIVRNSCTKLSMSSG